MDDADIRIVLVHGTWGRGFIPTKTSKTPRWFEHGSKFRTALTERLAASQLIPCYEIIEWSGSNSINERSAAADKLATHLNASMLSDLTSPHVIIGHSHGGSVAMLACHRLQQQKVDTSRLHVATMGTPFVEVHLVKSLLARIGTYIWKPQLLITLLVAIWAFGISIGGGLLLQIFAALVAAPLAYIGVTLRLKWEATRTFPKRLLELRAATTDGASWPYVNQKLLVLRAIDDEASMALTAGSIINRLSHLYYAYFFKLMLMVLGLTAIAALVVNGGRTIGLPIDAYEQPIRYIVALPYAAVAIVALLAVIGLGVGRSVFGRELITAPRHYEINIQSVPDASRSATVVTVQSEVGLRHSIYDLDDTPVEIVSWIERIVPRLDRT